MFSIEYRIKDLLAKLPLYNYYGPLKVHLHGTKMGISCFLFE